MTSDHNFNDRINQATDLAWEHALQHNDMNTDSLWNHIAAELNKDSTQAELAPLTADRHHMFCEDTFLSTYSDDPALITADTLRDFESYLPQLTQAQATIGKFQALNHLIRQYFIRSEALCPITFNESTLVSTVLAEKQTLQKAEPIYQVIPFPAWSMALAAAISLIVVVGQSRFFSSTLPSSTPTAASVPPVELIVMQDCDHSHSLVNSDPSMLLYSCTLGI